MKKKENNQEFDIKKRIIETAGKLFLRYGFSRVTTKEISETLGISKKTLYKIFPKKEFLIEAVFVFFRNEILDEINKILNDNNIELIGKIKKIMKTTGLMLSKFDKDILTDLKKSYPKIIKKLEKFEADQLLLKIEEMIEDGVKKGLFKKRLNVKMLVKFYFEAIKNFVSIENIQYINIPIQEFFDSILVILFEGALSDEYKGKFKS